MNDETKAIAKQAKRSEFKLSMSPDEARVVWGLLDGAIDAGACSDGLSKAESDAAHKVACAMLKFFQKHRCKPR